ncbi:MAG: NAD-dependent deacetylase [Actinomycetota bacterium]|jgi:NAD-dependent deacetylase
MATLEEAAGWVANARSIVVFTGAGISTDSGIPDFRGPNGVWTMNPGAERASTLQNYLADEELRKRAWQIRLNSPAWAAEPNDAHRALLALEHRGQLMTIITQNVDELHQRAGHDPSKVLEVHGTMRWARCWECGDRRPMPEVLERVRAGDPDPHCELCGGVLKSDTILFGEQLVPEVIEAAMHAARHCDLLIAAGSSLSVFPAANVVPRAREVGALVIIANGQPTEMDRYADAVIRGPLSETLPALCESRPNG